jgi:hypothetical protein
MSKCQAFFPIAGTREGWLPCARKAEQGSPFCRRHGDAILGAILGLLMSAEPLSQREKRAKEPESSARNLVMKKAES